MTTNTYNYETLEQEVARHGYEVVNVKTSIKNGTEYVVLAYSEMKKEYVTWVYNPFNNGLFSGNYYMAWTEPKNKAFEKAYANYLTR